MLTVCLGRKEITTFFYLFMVLTVLSLCLDSGVIPIGSTAHAYFVAVQCGLTSAVCTCLLINGFIGFQVYEDGTTLSVWLLRSMSILMFLITGGVALGTFQGWAGLAPNKTMALFVLLYVVNALFLFIYVVCQIILVVGTLEDRWPLGDIAFGILFFTAGQVVMYGFSTKICEQVFHFLDGIFFASICNLLGVMMVYKVRSRDSFRNEKTQLTGWNSIGTLSQRKIWSSASVQRQTYGKSRSIFLRMMTGERLSMITLDRAVITDPARTTGRTTE